MWWAEQTLALDLSQHSAVAEIPLPWVEQAALLHAEMLYLCTADVCKGRLVRHIRTGKQQRTLDLAIFPRRLDSQNAVRRYDLGQRHAPCDQILISDKLSEG